MANTTKFLIKLMNEGKTLEFDCFSLHLDSMLNPMLVGWNGAAKSMIALDAIHSMWTEGGEYAYHDRCNQGLVRALNKWIRDGSV